MLDILFLGVFVENVWVVEMCLDNLAHPINSGERKYYA